jgi:hypothetical protein
MACGLPTDRCAATLGAASCVARRRVVRRTHPDRDYPIIRAPSSYAYFTHSDTQLNLWILAWDAHALRHAPSQLFNANIFYPEPGTLAYSETLLGYLPIFGPILWLRGSPALAYNAIILFSFAAAGFAMYLLARHLTGREWPAIVAGIL